MRLANLINQNLQPAIIELQQQIDSLQEAVDSTSQQDIIDNLHSSEYQIARNADFTDIVYDHIQLFEDFYDVDENKLPKNVRSGLPVTTLELSATDLPSGNYYIRCRNRSMNLDWSDYSVPQAITVSNPTSPRLTLSSSYFKPGSNTRMHLLAPKLGLASMCRGSSQVPPIHRMPGNIRLHQVERYISPSMTLINTMQFSSITTDIQRSVHVSISPSTKHLVQV